MGKKLQGGYTGNYLCDFVAKVSTLATFFLRIFRIARSRVATCVIFIARWRPDKIWKITSPAQAKITRAARGLKVDSGLTFSSFCVLFLWCKEWEHSVVFVVYHLGYISNRPLSIIENVFEIRNDTPWSNLVLMLIVVLRRTVVWNCSFDNPSRSDVQTCVVKCHRLLK